MKNSTITIDDRGKRTLYAVWRDDLDGILEIESSSYRVKGLKQICDKYNLICAQQFINTLDPVEGIEINDRSFSTIKGLKDFDEALDLIIEFRKNLG